MIFSPTLIIAGVSAAVSAVAGFGLAWQLQAGTIAKNALEQANERIAIQRNARQTLERNQATFAKAQANATVRGIASRADRDRTINAAAGLRVTTANTVRTAADDPAVCPQSAATLGKLFDASVAQYRELAERSDRHVIDIQAMMEREAR